MADEANETGEASEPEAPVHPALQAIDRHQEVVKWLVAAFAAIGATLVAGSQLSEVGDLTGWRLFAAFGGVALAIGGVSAAIWFAAWMLTSSYGSLARLAREEPHSAAGAFVREDPDILVLENTRTIGELKSRRDEGLRKEADAWAKSEADPGNKTLAASAEEAQTYRQRVDDAVHQFLPLAVYAEASARFKRTLAVMFAGAVLAAGGILLFAWAAHPAEDSTAKAKSAAPKEPTEVVVSLSKQGKDLLGEDLGERCGTEDLQALAIGGQAGALDVVALPRAGCAPVRFSLTSELGTAIGADEVEPVPVCASRDKPQPPCIVR